MKNMNSFEFSNENNELKDMKKIDSNDKEKLGKWDLDEPILEQIESIENDIDKGKEKLEDIIDIPNEWDLDEPILDQIRRFDNADENFKVDEKLNEDEKLENFKIELEERTGWSNEVIDSISSIEEAEHYESLALTEEIVNDKICLVKENLDTETPVDPQGRTNKERMEEGLSPIDENGDKIELHHIGQKADGPLVELNTGEHRGKEIYSILHENLNESEINRNEFNKEKENHWKSRF